MSKYQKKAKFLSWEGIYVAKHVQILLCISMQKVLNLFKVGISTKISQKSFLLFEGGGGGLTGQVLSQCFQH